MTRFSATVTVKSGPYQDVGQGESFDFDLLADNREQASETVLDLFHRSVPVGHLDDLRLDVKIVSVRAPERVPVEIVV